MKTIFFDLDGTLTILKEAPSLRPLINSGIIKKLAQRYQLGLITASKTKEALFALRTLNIQRYFQPNLIITADTCPFPKITGKPFIIAKEKVSEVIAMIGDSEADRIGSEKADILFVHITKFNPKIF